MNTDLEYWKNLKFEYLKTDFRFQAVNSGGKWDSGELITDSKISLEEGATSLHYAQQCFEGMKAYGSPSGGVNLFRPRENAKRMANTAKRLLMQTVPEELFLKGVTETVKANLKFVPPHASKASLYIRPLLIGDGENLGIKTASRNIFRVFCSPVGPYYKAGGLKAVSMLVSEKYDRAAPHGIGNFKAGSNYAGGMAATAASQEKGYNECIYFDSKEGRFLDEAGSANIIVATKDNKLITPKSDSILPSITRKSIMVLAKDKLRMETEERPIDFLAELDNISEIGACGTAAVISAIGRIGFKGKDYLFFDEGRSPGPVMSELYRLLTGIQFGELDDPYGWRYPVT